jgi:DNA-binding MarR family transcriptional regulator
VRCGDAGRLYLRQAADYITRRRSSDDERLLVVELTDAGRALRAEAEKIPYAVVERLALPVSDLEDLHTSLSRVIRAATAAPAATTPTAAPA